LAERKAFLLRIDPGVLGAVQRWANDDLRSLNAQVEFLLRRSLQQAGRARVLGGEGSGAGGPGGEEPDPFPAPQPPGTARRRAKRGGEP